MLRITTIDTPTEQKFILEGRLTEPWVAQLDLYWETMRHVSARRKFVVDLRGVTRVDGRGESALARMKSDGAEFLARYGMSPALGATADPRSGGPRRITQSSNCKHR